jgi:phospholipid N-methyltransferase
MANNLIFKNTSWLACSILACDICCLPACTMLDQRAKNHQAIGAVAESSSYLANTITSKIHAFGSKKRILEVGAGTGVFTEKIIKKLSPHDHLDVVELMPDLCNILVDKFGHYPNVNIYCGDILDWSPKEPYSHIISGLPFNSFSADLIKRITDRYVTYSRSGTICAFFEYKWLPDLRQLSMNSEEKSRFLATRKAINDFVSSYEKSNANVYINIPPAIVHFLEINKHINQLRTQRSS